jgi:hypothetical protein
MAATAASSWILASSRPSRSEFQHSSPTFGPHILVAVVGTSSWKASPTVGNASVDDTDAAATASFFFATDGKTFVPFWIVTFVIWANVEWLANSFIYVFKWTSSLAECNFIDAVLNVGGSGEGEGGGTDNDAAPWRLVYCCDDYVLFWWVCIAGLLWWIWIVVAYVETCTSVCWIYSVTYFGGSHPEIQPKQGLYKKSNIFIG